MSLFPCEYFLYLNIQHICLFTQWMALFPDLPGAFIIHFIDLEETLLDPWKWFVASSTTIIHWVPAITFIKHLVKLFHLVLIYMSCAWWICLLCSNVFWNIMTWKQMQHFTCIIKAIHIFLIMTVSVLSDIVILVCHLLIYMLCFSKFHVAKR